MEIAPPWLGGGANLDSFLLPLALPADGVVLYADSIDLDCDGRRDIVAQVRLPAGPENPVFIAFVRDSAGGWRRVLMDESPVAGLEAVVVAADLNGDSSLDLVTMGLDEGGQIPRVFTSQASTYRRAFVPVRYLLRNEADWDSRCLRHVLPKLVEGGRLALSRETLSRTARVGHGRDCGFPVDTLTIQGDTLR